MDVFSKVKDKLRAAGDGSILRRGTGATDVIIVQHKIQGTSRHESLPRLACSDFNVHFGREAKIGQPLTGLPVKIWVNNTLLSFGMEVGQDLQCVFADGELRPSDKEVEELASVMKQGPNSLRFQLQGDRALYDVNAAAFLWSSTDKAIVCDIDGTLTRSDIIGYSAHVLGYEYMHEGVTEALSHLSDCGYNLIFLSARPITASHQTRAFLLQVGMSARDNTVQAVGRGLGLHTSSTVCGLPRGPLLTTSARSLPLLASVVLPARVAAAASSFLPKSPAPFKAGVLLAIRELFDDVPPEWRRRLEEERGRGGKDAAMVDAGKSKVLMGGFGNRPSDLEGYVAAGVPADRVFLVNETSRVTCNGREMFSSYDSLIEQIPSLFPPIAVNALRHSPTDITSANLAGGDALSSTPLFNPEAVKSAFELFGGGEDGSDQHKLAGGGGAGVTSVRKPSIGGGAPRAPKASKGEEEEDEEEEEEEEEEGGGDDCAVGGVVSGGSSKKGPRGGDGGGVGVEEVGRGFFTSGSSGEKQRQQRARTRAENKEERGGRGVTFGGEYVSPHGEGSKNSSTSSHGGLDGGGSRQESGKALSTEGGFLGRRMGDGGGGGRGRGDAGINSSAAAAAPPPPRTKLVHNIGGITGGQESARGGAKVGVDDDGDDDWM